MNECQNIIIVFIRQGTRSGTILPILCLLTLHEHYVIIKTFWNFKSLISHQLWPSFNHSIPPSPNRPTLIRCLHHYCILFVPQVLSATVMSLTCCIFFSIRTQTLSLFLFFLSTSFFFLLHSLSPSSLLFHLSFSQYLCYTIIILAFSSSFLILVCCISSWHLVFLFSFFFWQIDLSILYIWFLNFLL